MRHQQEAAPIPQPLPCPLSLFPYYIVDGAKADYSATPLADRFLVHALTAHLAYRRCWLVFLAANISRHLSVHLAVYLWTIFCTALVLPLSFSLWFSSALL